MSLTKSAIEGGWINDDMNEEQQITSINAMVEHNRAQTALKEQNAQNAEARSAAGEVRAAFDFSQKHDTRNTLNKIVETTFTKFSNQASSLITRFRNGDDPTQLIQLLDQQMATIQANAGAVAKGDPSYAATALVPFQSTYDATLKFLTGQIDQKALENTLKSAITRSKLQILSTDPEARKIVATSQLLGNAFPLLPGISEAVVRIMGDKSTNPMSPHQNETRSSFDIWKLNMRGTVTGSIPKEEVEEDTTSFINKTLRGVQAYSLAVEDPKQYNQVYDLIASPEMATAVKEGMVDGDVSLAAKQVLAREWESEAVRSLDADMKKRISGAAAFGGPALQFGATEDITDVVVPVFRGSGVTFTLSGSALIAGSRGLAKEKSPTEQAAIGARSRRLDQFINGLQTGTPSKLLNKMIKAGAHLEGHTDYKKYWEENKELLLPTFFLDKEAADDFLIRGILPQEQKEDAGLPQVEEATPPVPKP